MSDTLQKLVYAKFGALGSPTLEGRDLRLLDGIDKRTAAIRHMLEHGPMSHGVLRQNLNEALALMFQISNINGVDLLEGFDRWVKDPMENNRTASEE